MVELQNFLNAPRILLISLGSSLDLHLPFWVPACFHANKWCVHLVTGCVAPLTFCPLDVSPLHWMFCHQDVSPPDVSPTQWTFCPHLLFYVCYFYNTGTWRTGGQTELLSISRISVVTRDKNENEKLLPHVFREREQKYSGYFVIKLRPKPTNNEHHRPNYSTQPYNVLSTAK